MTSFLYAGNAPYVEDQYEQYLVDPSAVSGEWKGYFDALRATPALDGSQTLDVAHAPVIDRFVALAKRHTNVVATTEDPLVAARRQVGAQSLIHAYRMVGTRMARLDPLEWTPVAAIPELTPAFHGFTASDASRRVSTTDTSFWDHDATLGELWVALEETYCGTLSSEFMHLADPDQRRWWQMHLESMRAKPALDNHVKLRILQNLVAAEGLEKYLNVRYVGQTRFSLEGGESLIVLLDELVHGSVAQGVKHLVLGMAHRGRLNVLVNTAGKPPKALFDEFEGHADHDLLAGDVKYHKGYAGRRTTEQGTVEVHLAFNPSHLEMVNPVVEGIARGLGEKHRVSNSEVLPVEIHGDAAIAGQGIVMETLSLTYTRGHGTGGTIHVVLNNQVGFTTSDPRDTRSSFYCTDIAKMIEAPILHVNGDDPPAVALAAQLALEYRRQFSKSVVIELVCFRRYGHQEQDTPDMTQPLMYRAIARHPGLKTLYAQRLVRESVVTQAEVEQFSRDYREHLEEAKLESGRTSLAESATDSQAPGVQGFAEGRDYVAPSLEQLRTLATRITEIPEGFELHPLVARVMESRRDMALGKKPIDWGMGEHLAFASLLIAGIDVRMSGQDSERGTFGHRHAVLHDQNRERRSEGTYSPLSHIDPGQGQFRVTNSILSESAVLAFEYGYSITRPNSLVLWEAQYGDFANGAQAVIDQFIAAASAKWGQQSGLVMLLPHGQEGQGPEHASARLERYLQLCAQDNLRVCQPTTSVQYFHLLRTHASSLDRRPLIVMTPKSLLRHPAAASRLDELSGGEFRDVLPDPDVAASDSGSIERVILCSGKVFYDLLERRRKVAAKTTAVLRLEQLYPFPAERLRSEIARYENVSVVVWCQEEAENQGAWRSIEPALASLIPTTAVLRYAGRPPMASTAPGTAAAHAVQQESLVADALAR